MKRFLALLVLIHALAFYAFSDSSLSFPSTADSFDPKTGSRTTIRIQVTPTTIYPQFAIYGGTDLNYGSIGAFNGSSGAVNGMTNVVVSSQNLKSQNVEIMVKVVQYNDVCCQGSYSLSVTASPFYLNGVVSEVANTFSADPYVKENSLSVPAAINYDGAEPVDFQSTWNSTSGPTVNFTVSYVSGLPIAPVYVENSVSKEVIVGTFTYVWAQNANLVGNEYHATITLTFSGS